jgi:ribose transport system ATP-binding protein
VSALIVSGLAKSYGDAAALRDVSLSVEEGEIHALVGENGAGKSTLVKTLCGVVTPDAGRVTVAGEHLALGSPGSSRRAGIYAAFQELSLLPNLSVAHNLLIASLPTTAGLVRSRDLVAKARDVLERWGVTDIDPRKPVGQLVLSARQRLEIVRAFEASPRILILDEPTASLPDTDWVFEHVRALRSRGTSVLYISHKLAEIAKLCDGGTIMRNGAVVDQFDATNFDHDQVISTMIGRSVDVAFPPRTSQIPDRDPILNVEDLAVEPALRGVSFGLRAGEILGIAGLEGQGQRELFYALSGALGHTGGAITCAGVGVTAKSPRAALRRQPGIALVPEERKSEGIFPDLDSVKNISVPRLRNVSRYGLLRRKAETTIAQDAARENHLPDEFLRRDVGRLSGGNQQKTILARVSLSGAGVLLMFDPTRGIDAGAKLEVYSTLRKAANDGTAILLYSTEIPELIGLSDRVLVLYGGRVVAEFDGDDVDESHVMTAAVGRAAKTNHEVAS